MGFSQGFIGLLLVVIVLAIFIPITGELLPTMISDMGSLTGMMVSSVVVVIIASALMIFMRNSMGDSHMDFQGGV